MPLKQLDHSKQDPAPGENNSIHRTVLEEPRRSFVSLVNRLLNGDRFSFLAAKVANETIEANNNRPLPERIDRFEVIRELGQGGFGVVYLAYDAVLERHVAIKMPHQSIAQDEIASARYLKEAQLASKLRHPGIVTIHDIRETEGRIEYIVQEYVEGTTLHDLMSRRKLSIRRSVELVLKMAEAIQAAHALGIYHRDLKPANVMIDQQNGAHILDFGLAIDEQTQLQLRGQIAGTIAYMSPEQLQGDAHHLDGRTDIWSLGVMFYEMLTGRKPFRGDSHETAEQVIQRQPTAPRQFHSEIPKRVETCCLKCLEKPTSQRYGSAIDLIEELQEILVNESLPDEELPPDSTESPGQIQLDTKMLAHDATKRVPARRVRKRQARWWVVIAIGLFALGGYAAFSAILGSGDDPLAAVDLLEERPIPLFGPAAGFDVDAFDKGQLTLHSQKSLLELFKPDIQMRDYDIHVELQQVGEWRGTFALLFAVRQSKTDPNCWIGGKLEICQDDDDPKRWHLDYMRVTIDKSKRQIPVINEIVMSLPLRRPPSDTETLLVQVRNGQLKWVSFVEFSHPEPGLPTLPELNSVVATNKAHGIFDFDLTGQVGVYARKTSLVVSKAVVLPAK